MQMKDTERFDDGDAPLSVLALDDDEIDEEKADDDEEWDDDDDWDDEEEEAAELWDDDDDAGVRRFVRPTRTGPFGLLLRVGGGCPAGRQIKHGPGGDQRECDSGLERTV